MVKKRLFLFAGYDPVGAARIDDATIIYVRALSKLGDVIYYADNDLSESELKKISPYTIYAGGTHHHEYDMGSHKRSYEWLRTTYTNHKHDFIYLVNDSVYLTGDIKNTILALEKLDTDAFGVICRPHKTRTHIQSWFIGMTPRVFNSDAFNNFIRGVTRQKSKGEITRLYELGFTRMLTENNFSWACLYKILGRGIYNNVVKNFRRGLPFIKKLSFTRHGGSLGRQIKYVLNHIAPKYQNAILQNANYVWGEKYVKNLLTYNPFKIIYRFLKYSLNKITREKL